MILLNIISQHLIRYASFEVKSHFLTALGYLLRQRNPTQTRESPKLIRPKTRRNFNYTIK
jgi:hypothetical protein